jgi:Lrp/AsnC family transcriptional regulator, leucine-responsive regulatory protein
MIDEIDWQIMKILQENSRTSNAEIARQVGMAPSAVFERLRKLEERGIITEYTASLNAKVVGLGLLAFIFVRVEERIGSNETALELAKIPEVQEIHHIAGEDCYLLKVRAEDTEALGRLLRESFGGIKTVRSTRTTIVLSTVKETAKLPLEREQEKGGRDDRE